MKKRLSKKILAAFLAVMMIVTSIPLGAFYAYAEEASGEATEDAAVTEVKNAMKQFQAKIAEGVSYTGTLNAYYKYTECQQGLDAYVYGGEKDALDGVADAMLQAIDEMQEYKLYTLEKGKYLTNFEGETSDGYTDQTSGVIWAETGVTLDSADLTGEGDYNSADFYWPRVAFLYTGTDDNQEYLSKVLVKLYGSGDTSWTINGKHNKNRYVSAVENTSSDWGFKNDWKGYGNGKPTSGNVQDWNAQFGNGTYTFSNTSDTSAVTSTATIQVRSGRTNGTHYFANLLKFNVTDSSFTGNQRYQKPFSLGQYIKVHTGSSTTWESNLNDSAGIYNFKDSNTSISFINYVPYMEANEKYAQIWADLDLTNYTNGGWKLALEQWEEFQTFNPGTYFENCTYDTYGKCVDQCATKEESVINGINTYYNNFKISSSTDNTGYIVLRTYIDRFRGQYEKGNTGYTEESWNNFVEKYEVLTQWMKNVNDKKLANGETIYDEISSTEANLAGLDVEDALAALVTKATKVDVYDLTSEIVKVENFMDKTLFTEDSMALLDKAIENAKIAVWGSVEGYGIQSDLLDDNEENRAIVQAQIAAIQKAKSELVVDPNAQITTTNYGKYSLNEALALFDQFTGDPNDYTGYETFKGAIEKGQNYKNNLPNTPMNDVDETKKTYKSYIDTIVNAYNSMEVTFMKTPDGTVTANSGNGTSTTIERMTAKDQGTQYVEGSLTNTGAIIKTTHDALNVAYGTFNVTFGSTTKSLENQALDSISINATADALGSNNDQLHINSRGWNSTPTALTDDQKATYAGCLTIGNFSVADLRYTGQNNYNNSPYKVVTQDGTSITNLSEAVAKDITQDLGTTDGTSSNPIKGAVFARSNGNDAGGEVYVKGNLCYTVPATEKVTLTADTVPTYSTDTFTSYFGAVTSWNCQNTANYSGFNWYTTKMNDQQISSTVYIIDLSTLFDLVSQCKAEITDGNKYTDYSWDNYTEALEAAQKSYKYTTLATNVNGAQAITSEMVKRYQNLWKAYQALTVRDVTLTFKHKDANGADTSSTLAISYGKTIADYISDFNKISVPDYVLDGYTYKFVEWTPSVNIAEAITTEATYTAVYDKTLNPSDWTAYNAAKQALLDALTDYTYTADSLAAAATSITALTYFEYTDDQKADKMADIQKAIDAETATLTSIKNALVKVTYETSVAEALAAAQASSEYSDEDRYTQLTDTFAYATPVTVAGTEVQGLIYADQTALDAAIANALNGITAKVYDIYLNDTKIGTVAYGTGVSVNAAGTVTALDNTDENTGDDTNYAWTYSYAAPSNNYTKSEAKYMITAPSFGFVVKGDTYLTATKAGSTDGDSSYIVTIKSSINNKILSVIATADDGSFTMPEAPSFTCYNFTGYSNNRKENTVAIVTEDTTIIANYEAQETELLTIDVYDNLDSYYEWEPTVTYNVAYNTKLSVSGKKAYCWCEALQDEEKIIYRVISYGSSYDFYASHTLTMDDVRTDGYVALTKSEYNDFVTNQVDDLGNFIDDVSEVYEIITDASGTPILPDTDNYGHKTVRDPEPAVTALDSCVYTADKDRFSLVGTFVAPSGYTMKECGFLFTKDTTATNMTIDGVGTNGVRRLKCSRYTVGNQFVVSITNPTSDVEYKYTPYAIIQADDGTVVTVYGTTATGSNSGNHN